MFPCLDLTCGELKVNHAVGCLYSAYPFGEILEVVASRIARGLLRSRDLSKTRFFVSESPMDCNHCSHYHDYCGKL